MARQTTEKRPNTVGRPTTTTTTAIIN